MLKHSLLTLTLTTFLIPAAEGATVFFDLQGNAGSGLLGGNENPPAAGGSGGELNAGIVYDDVTNMLTIDVGWGSGNGFTDLTGIATGMHIHQAPANSNGGVVIGLNGLAGFNNSASNGGFNGTVVLSAPQEATLLAGNFYINVHTTANPGGEIRGNMTAVPEPSALGLFGCLSLAGLYRRKRKS